ncbi:16474_t:CDS:2, partial [Gigaspora rosea]
QYPDEECIDLCLGSSFLKNLQRSIAMQYLSEMDEIMESLIPDDVHKFLTEFFSQDISDNECMKAFSLGTQNPLQTIFTIEQPHLNV